MRQSKLLKKFLIYFLNLGFLILFASLIFSQMQFNELTSEFRKQIDKNFENYKIYHWNAKVSKLPFSLGESKVAAQWHYHKFGLLKAEIQGFIRGEFGFVPVKVLFSRKQNKLTGKWKIEEVHLNEFSEFHNTGIAAPTTPYYRDLHSLYVLIGKAVRENCPIDAKFIPADPITFLKHQALRNAQRKIDFAFDIPAGEKIVRVISQMEWTKDNTWSSSVTAVNCDYKSN